MTGEKSSVSVIIPCYNVEDYVGDAVESVLRQTYPHLELICVDDGSTDGTLGILYHLQEQHDDEIPFKVLIGPNGGAPVARNKGLAEAKGEWIQFLDADDLLLPGKIKHQVELLHSGSIQPDLIVACTRRVGSSGKTDETSISTTDPWVGLLRSHLGYTCSNLWCRVSVEEIGGWNTRLSSNQEYDLMFRLLKNDARVVFDDACYTVHRRRAGSISGSNLEEHWTINLDMRRDMLQYLRSNNMLTAERLDAACERIFKRVRALYTLNLETAIAFHDELIPARYMPPVSRPIDYVYATLYRLWGFRRTEAVFSRLRQLALK